MLCPCARVAPGAVPAPDVSPSGDLPVALGVECKGAQRLRLYAHPGVMTRLRNHRLAELKSTGRGVRARGQGGGGQGVGRQAGQGTFACVCL